MSKNFFVPRGLDTLLLLRYDYVDFLVTVYNYTKPGDDFVFKFANLSRFDKDHYYKERTPVYSQESRLGKGFAIFHAVKPEEWNCIRKMNDQNFANLLTNVFKIPPQQMKERMETLNKTLKAAYYNMRFGILMKVEYEPHAVISNNSCFDFHVQQDNEPINSKESFLAIGIY